MSQSFGPPPGTEPKYPNIMDTVQRVTPPAAKKAESLPPCPFCGGTDLSTNDWWFIDDEGEVDAIECKTCYAGAPLKTWLKRRATVTAE